jgi:putative transposase
MKHDSRLHHRRSLRLKGYDYTQTGAYFVTIVTKDRECSFGEIANNEMQLNECGALTAKCWHEIPQHFKSVALGAWVVMPNHVHGVLVINANVGGGIPVGARHASPLPVSPRPGPQRQSIGAIVGSFKSAVTKHINTLRDTPGAPVWQRNYYEHIIRNEVALNRIQQYILNNPLRWARDKDLLKAGE